MFDSKDIPSILVKADIIVKVKRPAKEHEKTMATMFKDDPKQRIFIAQLEPSSDAKHLEEYREANFTSVSIDRLDFEA